MNLKGKFLFGLNKYIITKFIIMQQKKQTNYLFLALSIPLFFALVASGTFSGCDFKSNADRHFKSDVSNITVDPIEVYSCPYEGQECPNYYKGCTGHPEPVNIEYYKPGEILLPSYACPDTLIVMDAATLNKNFAYVEQNKSWGTDADIDSLLHCPNKQNLPACMDFYQYVDYLQGIGYSKEISKHLALVDFGRLKADSLYNAMMED